MQFIVPFCWCIWMRLLPMLTTRDNLKIFWNKSEEEFRYNWEAGNVVRYVVFIAWGSEKPSLHSVLWTSLFVWQAWAETHWQRSEGDAEVSWGGEVEWLRLAAGWGAVWIYFWKHHLYQRQSFSCHGLKDMYCEYNSYSWPLCSLLLFLRAMECPRWE